MLKMAFILYLYLSSLSLICPCLYVGFSFLFFLFFTEKDCTFYYNFLYYVQGRSGVLKTYYFIPEEHTNLSELISLFVPLLKEKLSNSHKKVSHFIMELNIYIMVRIKICHYTQ